MFITRSEGVIRNSKFKDVAIASLVDVLDKYFFPTTKVGEEKFSHCVMQRLYIFRFCMYNVLFRISLAP